MRNNIEPEASGPSQELAKSRTVKPLTSRLRKSKNFHKEDRMLDDFLDRTKLLNNGEKRTLRKLLKLRKHEDGNQVKVTISGLKVLLGVDIKTVRRCLKGLVAKGFLVYDGITSEPGLNYSKKLYSFPITFPGFDVGTVFTRKGDKKRYKAKLERRAQQSVKARRNSFFSSKVTCPNSTRLVDCSSPDSRRTCKNSEDTNVSSEFITDVQTRLAAPNEPKHGTLERKKEKDIGILTRHRDLRHLIQSILSAHKCSGQIAYVSRFMDQLCDQNLTYQTAEDRIALAQDLYEMLGEQFMASDDYKALNLRSLFRFLRSFINLSVAPSFFKTARYYEFRGTLTSNHFDQIDEFYKDYPWVRSKRTRIE